jgi:hypothetical protein
VAEDQVAAEAAHQHRQVAEDQEADQAAPQHHQVVEDNLQARKQLVLGNKDPVKTQAGRAVGGLVATKRPVTPTILVNLAQKAVAAKVVQVTVLTKAAPVQVVLRVAVKVVQVTVLTKAAPVQVVLRVAVTTRDNLTNLSKTKAAKTKKKRVAERKLPVWLARLQGLTSEVK